MKNFFPGWAEKHVPAPGSERPYTGLASYDDQGPMSDVPPTPEGRLSAEEARARRALARLERLAS